MKNNNIRVSILLPVCNAGQFIEMSIRSLLRQTYGDLEIIAIDDDSKDDSWKILRSLAKEDKRLKISRNKKRYGLGICLNRGVKKAKGRFIAFMNANDLASLHKTKRQVSFLLQHPKLVAVGTQSVLLGKKSKRMMKSDFPTDHDAMYHSLVTGNTMHYESVMIDRTLLPKDLLKFSSHKYPLVYSELIVKLIKYGKLANINQHLYYHREMSLITTKTTQSTAEQKISVLKLWLKSIAVHDYRPSVSVILQPLLAPVRTIFR